jgi:predicted nucleic acid-binding protein
VYADTSFLVSLYAPDAHSKRAARAVARFNPNLLLVPLCELELVNALELRVFRKEQDANTMLAAIQIVREHIAEGFLSLQSTPSEAFADAQRMALRHTAMLGVRSLDLLHVACASLLNAEKFFTFDLRQRDLARAEGLDAPRL